MYSHIAGKLFEKRADSAVVDAGGVGYLIQTSTRTIAGLPAAGESVTFYTKLIVREDSMTLFGFLSRDELSMFEILLTAPKVGPKVALSIISAFSPSQFGLAVLSDDYRLLAAAKGVGIKSAQAIVFALKDKLKKETARVPGSAFAFSPTSNSGKANNSESEAMTENGSVGLSEKGDSRAKYADAVGALTILGYSPYEAGEAVCAVFSEEAGLEEIVKEALRRGLTGGSAALYN